MVSLGAEDGLPLLGQQDSDDDGCREEDDILCPPSKTSTAKTMLKEWRLRRRVGSRKATNCRRNLDSTASTGITHTHRRSAELMICMIVSTVLAGILGCVVGLYIGESLGQASGKGGEGQCNKINAPVAEPYDWGGKVVIDGTSYNVTEVFSSKLYSDDIYNFLS